LSSPPLQPAMPPNPIWWEIGRPSPENTLDWITWVAPLGDHGAALYRTLVVADGSITVAIEFYPGRGSVRRAIYRGRCDLPQDPEPTTERVHALLRAADEAVSKALHEDRSGAGVETAHERGSSRPASAPQSTQEAAAPAGAHDPEHYLRERAYFLWEREGRPEGRAQEFWERAHWEGVRAA
jgi:hypothetical protein